MLLHIPLVSTTDPDLIHALDQRSLESVSSDDSGLGDDDDQSKRDGDDVQGATDPNHDAVYTRSLLGGATILAQLPRQMTNNEILAGTVRSHCVHSE
jgi:hypothetical protein